jgi:hypothetical protein
MAAFRNQTFAGERKVAAAPASTIDRVSAKVARTLRIGRYPSLHDSGISKSLHHTFEIGGVFVGQDFPAVFQRIVGVDAEYLGPSGASFFAAPEMTVTGGQKRA